MKEKFNNSLFRTFKSELDQCFSSFSVPCYNNDLIFFHFENHDFIVENSDLAPNSPAAKPDF